MKKWIERMVLMVLCVIMILSLMACSPLTTVLPVPETITDLEKKLAQENAALGTTKANLYFDNTKSMMGYLNKDGAGGSNFILTCDKIIKIVRGYTNYEFFALKRDNSGSVLHHWASMPESEMNRFRNADEDFYTFKTYFDSANGDRGPLQSLFKNTVKDEENNPDADNTKTYVNFDELNVFITDLCEQKMNNKVLAQQINDIVLEKDGCSVALYRIESNFSGEVHIPVPAWEGADPFSTFEGEPYTDVRPFYCLITGPTAEVVNLCQTINKALAESNIGDYNYATVYSKRGLCYSPVTAENAKADLFDDITLDGDKYSVYEEYDIGDDSRLEFNLNYKMEWLNPSDKIFRNVDDDLPGLYYKYNPDNGPSYNVIKSTGKSEASIRYIIPLSMLVDGNDPQNVEYALKAGSFKVLGTKLSEVRTTDEDGEEVVLNQYEWPIIDSHKLLGGSSPYMKTPTIQYCPKGSTISRLALNPKTNKPYTNEDLYEMEFPQKEKDLYPVEDEAGVLLVDVGFENIELMRKEYDYVSIAFSVDGKVKIDDNSIPGWIKDYNLSDTYVPDQAHPLASKEPFLKTYGLLDFYSVLSGNIQGADKTAYEAKMVRTISDSVITVQLKDD